MAVAVDQPEPPEPEVAMEADPWLPGDENNDDDHPQHDVQAAPEPPQVGPRRGRPPGNLAFRRAMDQARAVLQQQQQEQQEPAAQDIAVAEAPQCTLAALLRPIGTTAMQLVQQSICRTDVKPAHESLKRLLAHSLGCLPRPLIGVKAEAMLLDTKRQHLPAQIEVLAAAIHFGSKAWLGSMASHLRTKCILGELRPVAVIQFRLYDSTQFYIASNPQTRCAISPDMPSIIDRAQPDALAVYSKGGDMLPGGKRPATKCKVVQTELSIGYLYQNVATARYTFIRSPVSCPLQTCNHETAEALNFLQNEQRSIPQVQATMAAFPLSMQFATCDSGSANVKFEAIDAETNKEAFPAKP
jgi:hypothetical protein